MLKIRYFFCVVVCALMGVLSAEADMRVKSFNVLEMDLDARVKEPIIDKKTNLKCPIVKIVTTAEGFYFDIGAMGAPEKVVYKKEMGEVWVYLPVKTAKLKISHPKYGQITTDTKDGYFWFPNARLQAATCYRMELDVSRGAIEVDDEDRVKTGWVVIESEPQGADVYIGIDDDKLEYVGQTPFQKKYPYGRYYFSLRKNMYHRMQSFFDLNQTRIQETFPLDPAFGKMHITSTPSGARVTIDGVPGEYTTPCTTGELASGEYSVRLTLDKYNPVVKQVTVTDGQTAELAVAMAANFAVLTVNSLPGAQISINGEVAGTGSVTRELGEGIYDLTAKLKSHKDATRQVEVVANQPQTVELKPTPIYGSLDVMTTPLDAEITIGGKSYGRTPTTIEKLLIGEYDVVLSKQGCATVTKHVTVAEKQTANVEATLPQGRKVNFTGTAGATVMVGDEILGTIPCNAVLTFGEHQVFASLGDEKEAKVASQTLNVTEGSGDLECQLTLAPAESLKPRWSPSVTASQRAVLERLVENMVKVEGGAFTMGATKEQGKDAYYWESPAHQVTLSDCYIGKYEVTQAEWETVMGTNPSYFKGDNRPVEFVSWDECQEFIKKLNSLTGLNFSLPTEAQWEYAARGGNRSLGYKYSGSNYIGSVAWYDDNSGNKTHPVGMKQANELGLYDMSGNVWEWCSDWFGSYSSNSQTNPTGAAGGSRHVYRGGSYYGGARHCRVSDRSNLPPDSRINSLGLRLAFASE